MLWVLEVSSDNMGWVEAASSVNRKYQDLLEWWVNLHDCHSLWHNLEGVACLELERRNTPTGKRVVKSPGEAPKY